MLKKNYYIIGAGFAGRAIAGDIITQNAGAILAFLDDDSAKIGQSLHNAPVLGPIAQVLPALNKEAAILIAIPSLNSGQLNTIFNWARMAGFKDITLLPRLSQLVAPQGSILMTRNIEAADLLGRDPILLSPEKTLPYIKGKRVLITGAGGSIGSELARQLLIAGCARLYLFGHGENSIYQIERQLKKLQQAGIGNGASLVPVIGDMQDKHYIVSLIARLNVDIIFHCAAHKHVPLMEQNPVEAIKNNLFGLVNIVEAAKQAGTARLVFISTDKAVEPTNTYGASKALGEELILSANAAGHNFFIVRFGNVLGSRGSIIPLFEEQIKQGGPLTVTHPKVKRYFMTIPEAVSLILLSPNVKNPAALFLLDMGEAISISELAKKVALIYGLNVDNGDIAIKYIGLREGETLEEELLGQNEEADLTEYPWLLAVKKKEPFNEAAFNHLLAKLYPICYYDAEQPARFRSRRLLHRLLADYYKNFTYNLNEDEY
ncbi:MAG: SDR family NAD(P)-dependent oxidoreductase [Spirochaetaceae bacterium]|nr:SDR family NAD(P)-dependent oxidoreductase [Spirochaetaceae bacterium]